ncbi:Para-nitrobenzyl esterase [Psilocybe cubensis]|uniref:Para-nitrobenzyl esterase n=2 Tax=Psilocybe cubensis TaxID=181762 RepID=A0ACB8HCJ3_PSICU|nr:Para-nitrobenzyl esterase [Psilocybe cubensis]KAH9485648.1 Para-nitrobenzyl esterase [Psilocybe cubensis]
MKFLLVVLTSALSVCHAISIHSRTNGGLIVNTVQGTVSGTFVTPTVRQFLGIPYASAGRWQPPTSPPKRRSILSATSYSDTCPQNLAPANLEFLKLAGGQGIDIPESESCLTANIWAPSLNRKQKTAVLIWIYGGAFQFGSSNLPIYNGQNFVRDNEDITIVTFNYRLNIFGQPNAPQLVSKTGSQNFGLLDIEAAVQWVHENIAAFGGDPDRISLFGQSAGSTATDAYAFSHPQDKIVKGIIQQSGNLGLVTNGLLANPTLDETTWNNLASSLGCGKTANSAQLSCMKEIPSRTLENAVIKTGSNFNLVTDNITIFSDIASRSAAGNFLKVPVLGGSTLNEGDIFTVASQLISPSGVALPFVTEILSDIQTQTTFTCPAGASAQIRLNAKVPTWRYQYQAVFPNISPRPDLRSYHASEIPIVFGTFNTTPSVPSTPTEILLSHYMQSAWVAFARNPSEGLVNFGWPLYDPTSPTLVQIGNAANATGMVLTTGSLLDTTCGNVPELLEFSGQLSANFA